MAIKPLKLKQYISEEEAAQLLTLLIGEEVSGDDMAEYARSGVVPAYIEFAPADGQEYPGEGFYLLAREDENDPHLLKVPFGCDWWQDVLPYPLPSDGRLVDSYGTEWKALIANADGYLEPASGERYARIYAPQEICQVAQILNDPTACPEWPAVIHSHGPSWTYSDDESDENGPLHFISPYDDALGYQIQAIKRARGELPEPGKGKRRINWQLIVAGLRELLGPEWQKQEAIAAAIGERGWKGARKDDVKHALREANREAKEELDK
ncbi:hypothetical protein SAMN05216206_2162 [Pseudomonas guineae]|uniref:Uncharacterized protein n=1 Tax=Pseudomonas guineae TaxID=425504 RepID=A0A1I3HZC8_9PSED|nr:hypothetical protein [Pseudomonas guineae]SFI40950.1 hypothetical protein SAMN05216206_2162 [Pseudomonas guineae]